MNNLNDYLLRLEMRALPLVTNSKQWLISIFIFFVLFSVNIFFEYLSYTKLKSSPIFQTNAQVINIYFKKDYNVLKLKSEDFEFFTSVSKDIDFQKLDYVSISLITTQISFYNYLKNFYANSFNLYKLNKNSLKKDINNFIYSQHTNQNISEIFSAIFLAVPTNTYLRDVFSVYSISHLIAISGFHLAVLSAVIYFMLYYPYSFIHKRFFPYRNIRYDLVLFSIIILFFYLLFTNLVPSLLRAFVMMCFGLFLLRSNLKLISFETLFLTLLLVIALFPKYMFAISFWFSIIGVFYIFLFIKYFQNQNKIWMLLFFNFWIFFSFNPIVHYFFGVTSWIQLLSPFTTMIFTIFYPLELFLHMIGVGNLLDSFLIDFINIKYQTKDIMTPFWFFMVYVFISFFSIWSKKAFIVLNILLVGFNIYLYV